MKGLDKYYILWYTSFITQYSGLRMDCPYCNFYDSKVIDSREVNDGIRRRRECLSCGSRFTTYERLQPASLFVIKKDERREEFNQDKLLTGIRKACDKRPLPTGTAEKLAGGIEAELYQLGRSEVPSAIIGDMVMERLKNLDHVAYIRFASVYREFADITALKHEVDTLVESEVSVSLHTSQLPLLPDDKLEEVARSRPRGERGGRRKTNAKTGSRRWARLSKQITNN